MRRYEGDKVVLNITVIPVLLDNTPLSEYLAAIHGIDLRPTRVHRLDPVRTIAPRVIWIARRFLEASVRNRRWVDSILSYSLVIVIVAAWWFLFVTLFKDVMSTAVMAMSTSVKYLVVCGPVVLSVVLAVTMCAGRRWRLRALAKDYTRPGSVGDFVVREFNRRLRQS
jgi:hypothetical protein